ncbi:MAG: PIN domain-containing protein [Caldilineaceae bacterium]|nr:PIN domain-containing protein [Caldilineaceae bacterium]
MADSLYVADTHTLVWHLAVDAQLGKSASRILNDPASRILIPSIVLAEALYILERKPHLYSISETELLREIAQDNRMKIAVLDQETVAKTLDCKAISEMHDRQIVATALLAEEAGFDVAILTKDDNITQSGLAACVW